VALNDFHGPLADDRDYDWATRARDHTRQLAVNLNTRLAVSVADTDPKRAAWLLEAACDLDPHTEDVAQHALRALARLGDTDAIKTRLRRLRAALDELDESPTSRPKNSPRPLLARSATPTRSSPAAERPRPRPPAPAQGSHTH